MPKMYIYLRYTKRKFMMPRDVFPQVISNHRSGRTILLTTHHLDEAETLADRVAILHQVGSCGL